MVDPTSRGLLLLTALWVAWEPGPTLDTFAGVVMVALSGAAGLHVVTNIRRELRGAAAEAEAVALLL